MNKNEYFGISKSKDLSSRCPILDRCERRIKTIYSFGDFTSLDEMKNWGVFANNYGIDKISIRGEQFSFSVSKDRKDFYFKNACPEVSLFDNDYQLIPNIACVEGDRDRDRKVNEKRSIKCQHFSECPEFNHYNFNRKVITTKQRKTIPNKTKALLQREIKSQCPFCSNEDVDHFQIHHIDETPSNNEFDNLLMLCPNCHSKITKGDITIDEVISIKRNLIRS